MSSKDVGQVLINSLFYLGTQLVASITAFAAIPIYTRLFDSSEYGIFVVILTTINFLTIFGSGWLDGPVLRFYVKYQLRGEESNFISNIFVILIMSITIVALSGYVLISNLKPVFPFSTGSLIILMLLVFALDSLFKSFLNIAIASQYAKLYSSIFALHLTIRTLLGIGLLYFYRTISSLLIGWITMNLFFTGVIVYKLQIYNKINPRLLSFSIAKSVLRYGIPFIFSGAGGLAMDQIDRYLIMHFRGGGEVGIYNVGYLTSSYGVYIFSSFLMTAAYPAIVSVWENRGKSATQNLVSQLLRIYFLVGLPILVGISLLSKEILGVIFSDEYLIGYRIVPWVASGVFVAGLLQYYTKSFILLEKTAYYAGFHMFGAGMNIVLNLILIPPYGFWGAGVSTTLSYFALFIILFFLNRSLLKLNWALPKRSILSIFVASLMMGGVIYCLKAFTGIMNVWHLAAIISIGVIIYFLLAKVFGIIHDEELAIMKSFVQNIRLYRK